LGKQGLPVVRIYLRAEGTVTGYPSQTKFSRIVVHPTVFGGDETRKPDYGQAAITARDRWFIGKSISGNIDYEVHLLCARSDTYLCLEGKLQHIKMLSPHNEGPTYLHLICSVLIPL
jgi:hypothetical protein